MVSQWFLITFSKTIREKKSSLKPKAKGYNVRMAKNTLQTILLQETKSTQQPIQTYILLARDRQM